MSRISTVQPTIFATSGDHIGQKRCAQCGKTKDTSEFWGGRSFRCLMCAKDDPDNAKWRKLHRSINHQRIMASEGTPARRRQSAACARLKRTGITQAQYDAMQEEQGGVCAICGLPERQKSCLGNPKSLHADHDHETGSFRGLLCSRCNAGVGYLNDDPSLMEKAAQYLRRSKPVNSGL